MKRILFITISALIIGGLNNCSTSLQDSKNEFNISKHEVICKVWGFLKYYHPGVGSGKLNWDKKLFELIDAIDTISTSIELNKLISVTIKHCDQFENTTQDTAYLSGRIKFNRDFKWLKDSRYLSLENKKLLNSLILNKSPYTNHYISQNNDIGNLDFSNEVSYADSTFPSEKLRLLSLFRHWNIIYYFYPYLEINDSSWEEILKQYINRFINSGDSLDYNLTALEYTSRLNDGHIWTESITIALHLGIFSPPYKLVCVEDKPIINELFPDSIGNLFNVKIGDEILAIDNVPVDEIVRTRSKYYSFSNQNQFNRRIYEELLITPNKDSIILDINRKGIIFREVIPTFYLFNLYEILDRQEKNTPSYKIINDSTGYINLRYLDPHEVDTVMEILIELNKIIIDIRNYPHGVLYQLSDYFNPTPVEFVKIFMPNINTPGEFIWWEDPYMTGKSNPNYYSGKLVLLVNEQTQSHAEFTVMCLQTAPNVLTIGSITAGTDGNMSMIKLPGGIDTYFTGIGIEYPDSTPTQRIGIKIDTIIEPKVQDFANEYDRLLDIAIQL